MIVTNGATPNNNDKQLEAPPVEEKGKEEKDKKEATSKGKTAATPRGKTPAEAPKEAKEKPQLSIDTKKKQLKEQLAEQHSVASTPKVELEVVEEESLTKDEAKAEKSSNP